jgi:hypothetical protein
MAHTAEKCCRNSQDRNRLLRPVLVKVQGRNLLLLLLFQGTQQYGKN